MIQYDSSGFAEIIRAIERLEVDDDGKSRLDIRDDEVIVSFRLDDVWIVYLGRLDTDYWFLQSWNHGEFERVKEVVTIAGYGPLDIAWIRHSYIYTRTCTAIAGEWLLKKLNIPYSSYHPLMWNRELAIEYTRWRRIGL